MRFLALTASVVLATTSVTWQPSRSTSPTVPELRHFVTEHGVRLGILDPAEDPKRPTPVVFNFATSLEQSLDKGFNETALQLVAQGWRAISLDLPAHGRDMSPDEPLDRLMVWRQRIQAGQPFIDPFVARMRSVVDDLIAARIADPDRIAAVGISRGGFLALHAAARIPQLKAVMAFFPVTDLLALEQFKGTETDPQMTNLNLTRQAAALRSTPIWITIGTQDPVVSTTACLQFALSVYGQPGPPAKLELHVVPSEPHTAPLESYRDAATWAVKQFQRK